jgi:hypothetical protein
VWRQVPVVEVLEVMLWDSDITNDQCLGVVEIDIAEDVAKVPGGRVYKTWYLQVGGCSSAAFCAACSVVQSHKRRGWIVPSTGRCWFAYWC